MELFTRLYQSIFKQSYLYNCKLFLLGLNRYIRNYTFHRIFCYKLIPRLTNMLNDEGEHMNDLASELKVRLRTLNV